MSSDLHRFHAARIRTDSAALSEVKAALDRTVARRAEAQRVLDEVTREAAALEELQETLAARLAASRYDSIRICVSALPEDILRCVFEEAVHDGHLYVPFTLAAVCSRWRTVALASAGLWTTVHVFAPQSTSLSLMRTYNNLVTLHLARSRSAMLEIAVIWVAPTNFQENRAETIREFKAIMESLGAQVSRWKTARLFVPDLPEMADFSVVECLKGPTPRLMELVLCTRITSPQSRPSANQGFLPYTPALRSMAVHDRSLVYSSRSAFPSLTELHLWEGACTDEEMYDYLVRAPALMELDINITVSRAPSAKITLPDLQSLKIGSNSRSLLSEPFSTFLCLPKLARLYLDCAPDGAMTPFLKTVSPTVRSLRLGHRLTAPHLTILCDLQTLEELHLESGTAKTIDRSVLDLLASNEPPIWSRLTTLKGVALVNGIGDRLLGLIASRNPPLEARGTEAQVSGRPCRLREITFRHDDPVPEWLVQEMDRLLRL